VERCQKAYSPAFIMALPVTLLRAAFKEWQGVKTRTVKARIWQARTGRNVSFLMKVREHY
jgi:hypothetical protein